MDAITSNPTNPLISTSTPVFSDNVQNLLGTGTLQVNPTGIITVNSTADTIEDPNSGVTTLRDAISQANADTGEDLIVFDRSLFSTAQTITLNSGELDITHSLDIIAPLDTLTGGDLVTVSGNNASRVFEIETGATVNLSGLMITGGSVTRGNGGGISNSGTLNLDNTIVSSNNVISNFVSSTVFTVVSADGGGIYNTGTLNLSNSTVSSNTANDGTFNGVGDVSGGGIYNTGSVVISNSTVSGNRAQGAFAVYAYSNSKAGGIYNSGSLVISNSTLNNSASGSSGSAGGSIYNIGTVDVTNSSLIGSATGDMYGSSSGGSIYNSGTLNLSYSTISGSAIGGSYGFGRGGGIYNTGTAAITNSTISNSSGGGIYNSRNLTVSDTTIANNVTSGNGGPDGGTSGGIFNSGNATVSNSTINNNRTLPANVAGRFPISSDGGGIFNSGFITVSNSTISGNTATVGAFNNTGGNGGGIANSGTSTIIDSTITGNTPSGGTMGGGGISNSGTTEIINSTISGNSASTNGGGIYNSYTGTVTLLFSTVTQNQAANGGGVYQDDVPPTSTSVRGSFNVRNTIIAANLNNSAYGINPDVSGTFTSNGYNLIGHDTGSSGFGVTGDIVGTSDNPIDPLLSPLNSNGGPTQTIALLTGSPAIGAADPIVLDTDPITDQRGLPRRAADSSADIGAYELS